MINIDGLGFFAGFIAGVLFFLFRAVWDVSFESMVYR